MPQGLIVDSYPGSYGQVLTNLFLNAVTHAFTDEREGTIDISAKAVNDDIEISVADNGGGIPEAIRERIFDPFFTTKDVGKGTGQGLPIARSVVVDKHGGEFTFETEVGKGTTFFIRLPIQGRQRAGSVNVDEDVIG